MSRGRWVVLTCLLGAATVVGSGCTQQLGDVGEHLPTAGPVGNGHYSVPEEVNTANGTYRYSLVVTEGGAPVSWEPCAPVELVVNPDGGPPGAVDQVRAAAAQVEAASGVQLRVAGTTRERPSEDRDEAMLRYPGGWAPALVAWTDTEETPSFDDDRLGQAAPSGSTLNGPHWVSGQVLLDEDLATDAPAELRAAATHHVLLHELGHLLGLAHVGDPDEVMYPGGEHQTTLGPGDTAGLRVLGACHAG